jgi:hypothetical protein
MLPDQARLLMCRPLGGRRSAPLAQEPSERLALGIRRTFAQERTLWGARQSQARRSAQLV